MKVAVTISEHLLCARQSAKCRICIDELGGHGPCPHGASNLGGEAENQ